MPPVSRLGDIGSGHGSFPPTTVTSASNNTYANSIQIARQTDSLAPHGSPSPSPVHSRSICGGSETIYVNSLPVARLGDAICCGGLLVQGSSNIFCN